jgi:cephalosporin hydroxylase
MTNRVARKISATIAARQSAWQARPQSRFRQDLSFTAAAAAYPDRNDLYAYMHHYFHQLGPAVLRAHRAYYRLEKRGFGEDAFHAMWFTLLREFQPKECLEIGIYRGQVISLWALIARHCGFACDAHGISPFTSSGDAVSIYERDVDYLQDTLTHHRHFGLPAPNLMRAFSTDAGAVAHIRSRRWNLIYIDGNHDYEVALADYQVCRDSLAEGGLLVMDDSSLHTTYTPSMFSFAGHPGPSQVVQEFAKKELRLLGGVGHNNVFMKP